MHRPHPLTDSDVDDLLAIGLNLLSEWGDGQLSAFPGERWLEDTLERRLAMAGFLMADPWAPDPRQHRRWAPEVVAAAAALYGVDRWVTDYLIHVRPGVLSDLLDALVPDPSLAQLIMPPPTCADPRHYARWARRSIALIQGVGA